MGSLTQHPAYVALIGHLKEAATLGTTNAVLGWDEQTYLPPGGAEHRAEQTALLAGMYHQRMTDPQLGEWLATLEEQLPPDASEHDVAVWVNVRETRRRYDRATRTPRALVEELSRVATMAQQVWVAARRASDFSLFLPWLEKMVTLKREQAQAQQTDEHATLYDVLLDEYEPGMRAADVQRVFEPLREELTRLLGEITASGRRPRREVLQREYPVARQRELAIRVAEWIGFDFERGRLDESPHPFCTSLGPHDCRLTTRYDPHYFNSAFFGTLHEAGHGLYEQGLPPDAFGTPMGETVSLGIHESQSRMWENFVGRSRGFWRYCFPRLQEAFPEVLDDVSEDEFHFAVNDVQPSFIRVEADEVTYNLHIMLRFELEQEIIAGELKPADVPEEWNRRFERDFGLRPPDDAQGCLQDVHWSAGLIGYFPTYALGNMYAAQFYRAADRDLGELQGLFGRGDFTPLRRWLNEKIHRHGMRFRAAELVRVVCGEPLDHRPLIDHLRRKLAPLYGLQAVTD
ncbi:MAG: carboxypeptidase M32 [Planctomycetota bacterium]|nr:MAG: carboxypeptidase M32 [Planctomycetota bacterium]